MVKVLDETERNKKRIRKGSKLLRIAEQFFPEGKVESEEGWKNAFIYINPTPEEKGDPLCVASDFNKIDVKNKKYFKHAIRLARVYKKIGEEFTVIKDYE